MNLENIMLVELSQTQKDKYCMKQKVEPWLPGAEGVGNGELLLNDYGVSVWKDEQVLEMVADGICATV